MENCSSQRSTKCETIHKEPEAVVEIQDNELYPHKQLCELRDMQNNAGKKTCTQKCHEKIDRVDEPVLKNQRSLLEKYSNFKVPEQKKLLKDLKKRTLKKEEEEIESKKIFFSEGSVSACTSQDGLVNIVNYGGAPFGQPRLWSRDFGYIGLVESHNLKEITIKELKKLERGKGGRTSGCGSALPPLQHPASASMPNQKNGLKTILFGGKNNNLANVTNEIVIIDTNHFGTLRTTFKAKIVKSANNTMPWLPELENELQQRGDTPAPRYGSLMTRASGDFSSDMELILFGGVEQPFYNDPYVLFDKTRSIYEEETRDSKIYKLKISEEKNVYEWEVVPVFGEITARGFHCQDITNGQLAILGGLSLKNKTAQTLDLNPLIIDLSTGAMRSVTLDEPYKLSHSFLLKVESNEASPSHFLLFGGLYREEAVNTVFVMDENFRMVGSLRLKKVKPFFNASAFQLDHKTGEAFLIALGSGKGWVIWTPHQQIFAGSDNLSSSEEESDTTFA